MVEKSKSELFFWGIFPKCPFYKSVQAILIILFLIALGTAGTYFFNFWVAVGYLAYSFLFYFLVMPLTLCKYCYFKAKETKMDESTGQAIVKLLTIDKWRESHLKKHVGQKRWVSLMIVVWFAPIVLIVASFFLSFSVFALISLIVFLAMLVGNYLFMLWKKCPKCAIQKECHASF